jgi:glycosyltransferase involved in cell wall biosynthesis
MVLKKLWRCWLRFFRPVYISLSRSGVRQIIAGSGSGPQILLIAPAQMPLPNSGWGAVESLVLHQQRMFETKGYSTAILNSKNLGDWLSAFATKPEVVINHYDAFAQRSRIFSRFFRIPLIATSHYAFAQRREMWEGNFAKTLGHLSKADFFVALNEKIAEIIISQKGTAKVVVIPNLSLIDFEEMRPNRVAICLGKIEPRKRQFELLGALNKKDLVTLVGPLHDQRIGHKYAYNDIDIEQPWTREDVREKLPKYSVLVIISKSEADALVIHEALAAGLSVVTTESALGAQNPNHPWIYVVPEDLVGIENAINRAANENSKFRSQIRAEHSFLKSSTNYQKLWIDLVERAL